jgi:outer membrane lipoprotein-sorting protein
MKRIFCLLSCALLIILFMTPCRLPAASFSADVFTEKEEQVQTGKIFFHDRIYRLEMNENGKTMVMIADRQKNRHQVIDPDKKTYFSIASDNFKVLYSDPFRVSDYIAQKYGARTEGSESVSGYTCKKQVVHIRDVPAMTRWVSQELQFPIKIIMYQGKQTSTVQLKNIQPGRIPSHLLAPGADMRLVEAPGATVDRKRRDARSREAALTGLSKMGRTEIPCYVKIAAGGELRVPLDTARKAHLDVANQAKRQSEFIVTVYRNGKPLESRDPSRCNLEMKGDHRSWTFNDAFAQKSRSFLVDEVRIKVQKGLVYADVSQRGKDRKDFYNQGMQNGGNTDPKRPLTVRITGDNPFGEKTSGKFWLNDASGGRSEKIPFAVRTGKTLTWDYPADRRVKRVEVLIMSGEGRAKITLLHPTSTPPAPPQPVAIQAERPASRPTAKPKVASVPASSPQPKETAPSPGPSPAPGAAQQEPTAPDRLTLTKTRYAPGETVSFTFNAGQGMKTGAWIGLVPSSTPHGRSPVNLKHAVDYHMLNNNTSGTLTFPAPSETGTSWDIRLFDNDSSDGKEAASKTFTVN